MATKNVTYEIGLKDKMSKGLTDLENKSSKLGSVIKGVGITLAATFVAGRILNGIRNITAAYNEQAQANAQVEQGIRSTGGAAERTLDQLTTAASKMQSETIFGDESILQGVTSQLLTFTNISGKAFDRTQQAVLDVTTRLYGANAGAESLRSTSIQLGKALNDPVANLGALSRSGIQFSKQQKEQIKVLAESNRLGEAQALILSEIEKQYGGSAKAAAKANGGVWKQTKNIWGEINEEIGKRFSHSAELLGHGLKTLAQKAYDLVKVPLSEELGKNRIAMMAEFNVLKSGNLTVGQRRDLIQEINTKYGEYLPNLLNEKSSLQEIETAQNLVNTSLLKKIDIQAKSEIIEKALNKAAKARQSLIEGELRKEQLLEIAKERNQPTGNINRYWDYELEQRRKKAVGLETELERIGKSLGEFNPTVSTSIDPNGLKGVKTELEKVGITGITAAAPKVFNINIDKMIENFTVETSSVSEGATNIRESVKQILQEALTDVQAAAL